MHAHGPQQPGRAAGEHAAGPRAAGRRRGRGARAERRRRRRAAPPARAACFWPARCRAPQLLRRPGRRMPVSCCLPPARSSCCSQPGQGLSSQRATRLLFLQSARQTCWQHPLEPLPRRPAWCVLTACRPPRRCSRGRRGARDRERGGQQRAGGRGARRAGERRRRGARRGGRARGRRRRRGARRRGQARLPGRRGGAEAVRVRAEHPRAPQPAVAPGRRQPVLQPCALSPLAHARSWRPGAHARPGAPCSAALTGSFGPLRRSLPPAAASGQTRQPAVTQTSRFRV